MPTAYWRHEPTIDTDPRLAPALNQPRLRRVIAVQPAQSVIEWRRELCRIAGIDPRQCRQPAQQAGREIGIVGRSERRTGET